MVLFRPKVTNLAKSDYENSDHLSEISASVHVVHPVRTGPGFALPQHWFQRLSGERFFHFGDFFGCAGRDYSASGGAKLSKILQIVYIFWAPARLFIDL